MRWFLILGLIGCSYDPRPAEVVPVDAAEDTTAPDGASDGAAAPPDAAVDAPINTISCPGSMCGAICCEGTCVDAVASVCTGKVFQCDGPEDCGANQVCCNNQNGSTCTAGACSSGHEVCHSTADCSFSCGDCSFRSDYGQKVCCE